MAVHDRGRPAGPRLRTPGARPRRGARASSPGCHEASVELRAWEHGPRDFYLRYGFVETGEVEAENIRSS